MVNVGDEGREEEEKRESKKKDTVMSRVTINHNHFFDRHLLFSIYLSITRQRLLASPLVMVAFLENIFLSFFLFVALLIVN